MLEETLKKHNLKNVDYQDIGNAYQVTKEGNLLGYIFKEGWIWQEKKKAK